MKEKLSDKAKYFRYGLAGAILTMASIGSISCGPDAPEVIKQEAQILQEKGLLGEHPVVPLKDVPGFSANGNIGGGFLFIKGEFEGKITTMLQFAWKTTEEDRYIQISEVPYSKIKFYISENQEIKPSVVFNINPASLVVWSNSVGLTGGWRTTGGDNLNNYVSQSDFVTISLSQKDYDSFRATQGK